MSDIYSPTRKILCSKKISVLGEKFSTLFFSGFCYNLPKWYSPAIPLKFCFFAERKEIVSWEKEFHGGARQVWLKQSLGLPEMHILMSRSLVGGGRNHPLRVFTISLQREYNSTQPSLQGGRRRNQTITASQPLSENSQTHARLDLGRRAFHCGQG